MLSTCNDSVDTVEAQVLEAAAQCVVDYGFARVTLAEIARRAEVSRPTIYRRWPDTDSVLAAVLTDRITGAIGQVPDHGPSREQLVENIVAIAGLLRNDAVVMSVLHTAPEFMMVYITGRLGASQQFAIAALEGEIARGQAHGSIRSGITRELAAMVLLTVQSVLQSGVLVESMLDGDSLTTELAYMLNGYLAS
ncbi:TetR/AcrR family transcriptional regulator [Rhodococcus sp. 1168]|uniref:TetR/AcrR family transcriptional regulator n=1 Tax=Rhodococcus sp. 1168 TaxID=2018041 RepID=UPI000A0CA656|nr:TetR/AcrR family transcriptional regulator [Rhodococcus sp. 1168]ORI27656.1 TetR family transcriptional regulator [Rhodococcus sp. 1168]